MKDPAHKTLGLQPDRDGRVLSIELLECRVGRPPTTKCPHGHDKPPRKPCPECVRLWHRNNPRKRTRYHKKRQRRVRAAIADSYVKGLLKWRDAPEDFIVLKRVSLMLGRLAKVNKRYLNVAL